jgi:hypothetical protein
VPRRRAAARHGDVDRGAPPRATAMSMAARRCSLLEQSPLGQSPLGQSPLEQSLLERSPLGQSPLAIAARAIAARAIAARAITARASPSSCASPKSFDQLGAGENVPPLGVAP